MNRISRRQFSLKELIELSCSKIVQNGDGVLGLMELEKSFYCRYLSPFLYRRVMEMLTTL